MTRRSWTVLSLVLGAAACGAPSKEADEPKTAEAFDEPTFEEPASETPSPAPEPEPPPPAPAPAPAGDEPDYLMTNRDCRDLATSYGNAWRNDEMEKLNAQKLDAKAHGEARAAIEADAAEVRDQWQSQCDNTVGTPYRRSNLACAMKARTVARFDECWAGTAE